MDLFLIPDTRGKRSVNIEHIIRVESKSNYSKIFFIDTAPLVVAKVLHWFEDKLPVENFVRVHRSHLVNRMFIREINGTKQKSLLLHNGERVSISRRKGKIFFATENVSIN